MFFLVREISNENPNFEIASPYLQHFPCHIVGKNKNIDNILE